MTVPAALELARAMRSGRYLRVWSLTMLLVGVWHGAAAAAPAAPDHASVLILLPGQPGLPAATAIASGIRAVLLKEWSFRVTIEMEHVDDPAGGAIFRVRLRTDRPETN